MISILFSIFFSHFRYITSYAVFIGDEEKNHNTENFLKGNVNNEIMFRSKNIFVVNFVGLCGIFII
jgi:hypothetical protein